MAANSEMTGADREIIELLSARNQMWADRYIQAVLTTDRIGMRPGFNGYPEAFRLAMDGWPAWRIAEKMGSAASFVQMLKDNER